MERDVDRTRTVPDRAARDLAEYDRFRYDNFPFRATHPDWLGTVARLLGMDPAPADRCRVLELGCGRGGNLVGLAASLPGSTFVGIDHAPSQVADGLADVTALGLDNCAFHAMDIREVPVGDPAFERASFDYVICHGVYSWVPADVRARILSLTRELLTPEGVAFVSFNALPGWHARGMIRDALRRWVPEGSAAEMALAARSLLGLWAEHLPENGPLTAFVRHETDLLGRLSDNYLFFEHLVEHNEAFHLADVVADAASAGLGYLGDADPASMTSAQLGDDGQAAVDALGLDPVATEGLLDTLTVRFFRRALLCHSGSLPERTTDHHRLVGAWVQAEMDIEHVEVDLVAGTSPDSGDAGIDIVLRDSDGAALHPEDPHTAAMLWTLAEQRPRGMRLDDLAVEAARRLGVAADADFVDGIVEIAHALLWRGRLDAGFADRPIALEVGERPMTTDLVRHQARSERRIVTTLRHEHHAVDRMDIVLLRSLDGTLTVAELLQPVLDAQASGELEVSIDDVPVDDHDTLCELIDVKLDRFVRAALLVDRGAV
jgi:methyltransferase-like protein/ubiquinone/menaquinone biosynthesis C-methylase UbiE